MRNLLISLIFFIPLFSVAGEIYRWVDENGKVHYSDKTNKRLQEQAKEKAIEASTVEVGAVNSADEPDSFKRVYKSMANQQAYENRKKQDQYYAELQKYCAEFKAEIESYGLRGNTLTYMVDENGESLTEIEQQKELERMRRQYRNRGCR